MHSTTDDAQLTHCRQLNQHAATLFRCSRGTSRHHKGQLHVAIMVDACHTTEYRMSLFTLLHSVPCLVHCLGYMIGDYEKLQILHMYLLGDPTALRCGILIYTAWF